MEKTVETESEDEFAQSSNAVKAMKQEGAFSLSRVKRIAFVCDAGMGSSAMGATTFRKRLEKAGLAIEVKHYAIGKRACGCGYRRYSCQSGRARETCDG
ncbi:mannitol-specific cryptic PTS system EIICB component [Escherichia coli]|uniref:Mannitol-specific cryptic PTS system EIICB component n=1 Tax=Escherichia coli TaxID=562 RepID=A0A2X1KTI1_ECOLX|nr:mannitol-specific cryptic PTS system EIICB component [Escherichia coli]